MKTCTAGLAICAVVSVMGLSGCTHAKAARSNLPIGFVDAPRPDEVLRGVYPVRGFAVVEGGIRSVDIYLDREFVGTTNTGIERKDLIKPFPFTQNPGWGGWEYPLNAYSILPGKHEMFVNAVANGGSVRTIGDFVVNIQR